MRSDIGKWKSRRLKRWIPSVSFMDILITTPMMILLWLLFVTGRGIVFGVEGEELHTLAIPKVPIAGWLLIMFESQKFIPPVLKREINKKINGLVLYIKGLWRSDVVGSRI